MAPKNWLNFRLPPSKAPSFTASSPLCASARMAVLAGALVLGGCASKTSGFTGSIPAPGRIATVDTRPEMIAQLAQRYDARPGEKIASLEYAAALRANQQYPQAVAVLQRASIQNVGDREVAAAYGKALADIGQFDQAIQVLSIAHTEDRPNWQVLSTMGTILDQQGKHKEAREAYQRALQLAPNDPAVLNNFGLSYLLTREMAQAEEMLQRAANQPGADERIRANLALAQRLQGKNPAQGGASAARNAVPAKIGTERGQPMPLALGQPPKATEASAVASALPPQRPAKIPGSHLFNDKTLWPDTAASDKAP